MRTSLTHDATARHVRDNIKIADGDKLKALPRWARASQLQTHDNGDFSGASKKGLNY